MAKAAVVEQKEQAKPAPSRKAAADPMAAFTIGDERIEAGPGTVVSAPDPSQVRSYVALEPGTRIVCVGSAPGSPHPYGEWIDEADPVGH